MKIPWKIIIVVVLTAAFIVGVLDLITFIHLPGLLTAGIGLILVCVAANEWNGYKITKHKKYLITPILFMGSLLVVIVAKALNM